MNKETINREEKSTGEAFTASERRRVFWLVLVLIPLSWTSIKIVLPALPALGNLFHSTAGVKLSVSLYLIFFACSQPVWGGIVQKTSCRQTLFYSLFVTMTGTLIAMSSFNLPLYLIGRTLEGVGMGAASPIGRTLFTDVFGRKELARRMGVISGCAALMPAVAPITGGYLMTYIDWRAIFVFFLLLCAAYFYFAFRWLPETRINSGDEGVVTTRKLIETYISILRSTHYWGYILPYAALTGGLLGYYSAMPFWYHSQLGIAEATFAYFAIPTVGVYLIGLIVAGFLIKKIDLEEILFLGMLLAFCTAVVSTILAIQNVSGVASIVGVLSLYAFSAGLVSPNANAGVLVKFKKVAAPTAALVAVVLFGTAALTSIVTMNVYIKGTLWPVAGYLGTLSLIGLAASYFWVWRPYRGKKG